MIAVDFGGVFAVVEVVEGDADFVGAFVGDAANEPVVAAAFFAGNDEVFADGTHDGDGSFPVDGDVVDEFEGAGVDLFVEAGAIGGHLHAGGDGDEEGELAGEGGGEAFGGVGDVEDARGVVHGAGEKASEGEDAGVGRREGAAFVFLAAGTFAGEEVGESAFDAGAFDGFVDVEADVVFGGELEGFLVVEDAELRVVVFTFALDIHHGAGVARFDVVDAEVGVVFVAGFELSFVIVDETDSFVVADDFDTVLAGVFGDAGEVAVRLGVDEVGGLAVEEPVAIPATVPTLHEEAGDTEATASVDVFESVRSGGAMAFPAGPSPFTDIHGPPDAEEFDGFNPREVGGGWSVEAEHIVIFGEADGGAGDHNHAPRSVEREFDAGLDAV